MIKLVSIIIVCFALFSFYVYFKNKSPGNIGVVDGKLRGCPSTPNCVNSYSKDKRFWVASFPVKGTSESSIKELGFIIKKLPRSKIITQKPNYIHAEFRSKTFGFTDDLEFYANPMHPKIEVRSAARVGYSDLGVNRERVEKIRKLFEGD